MSFDKIFEKITKILEMEGIAELKNLDLTFDTVKTLLGPNILNGLQWMKEPNITGKGKLKITDSTKVHLPPINMGQLTNIEEVIFRRANGTEVRIGGDRVPPFYRFLTDQGSPITNPNAPKVTFDVFDMKISLPKPIKNAYREVLENPPQWAALAEKFGADMVTLHFVSTDPGGKDTPIPQAVKILEDVLQTVKIPIVIGGSGNKRKDTELFEACAAVLSGERLMFSSADKLTWDKIIPIANKHGQNVLLWAQLDINDQEKLVEDALAMGMPRNQIVLDPTCATLGYGLEYSFSIYQRIRQAGLRGNTALNFPLSAGTTNAWGAREAWMKELPHIPDNGGSVDLRGPLWEVMTALILALCGMNLAMMLHPVAAKTFKQIVNDFNEEIFSQLPKYENWVTTPF
jgi:acetyl-CoA decarbonylase/synthase complex subunit delta